MSTAHWAAESMTAYDIIWRDGIMGEYMTKLDVTAYDRMGQYKIIWQHLTSCDNISKFPNGRSWHCMCICIWMCNRIFICTCIRISIIQLRVWRGVRVCAVRPRCICITLCICICICSLICIFIMQIIQLAGCARVCSAGTADGRSWLSVVYLYLSVYLHFHLYMYLYLHHADYPIARVCSAATADGRSWLSVVYLYL